MALSIRADVSAVELRALARRERTGRVSSRLLGIANALDGMSRAEAARAAGMDRQTLCDWVPLQRRGRCWVAGQAERASATASEGAGQPCQHHLQGARPEEGRPTWTLPQLCRWIEARFNKRLHPASLRGAAMASRGRRHGSSAERCKGARALSFAPR